MTDFLFVNLPVCPIEIRLLVEKGPI
jgi:hypothetical protein